MTDYIAAHRHFTGRARRGSAIVNGGRDEIINVYDGNRITVETVEGEIRATITSLMGWPDFSVQTITPTVSKYGGTPHLVLNIHGFTAGASDQELVIISTDYEIVEG